MVVPFQCGSAFRGSNFPAGILPDGVLPRRELAAQQKSAVEPRFFIDTKRLRSISLTVSSSSKSAVS